MVCCIFFGPWIFPARQTGDPRLGKVHLVFVFAALLSSSVMAKSMKDNSGLPDYSHCTNTILSVDAGRLHRIKSPGFPKSFEPNICLLWSINMRHGYNITITYNLLEIPKLGDACGSYLDIGPKPFIRMCGRATKATVQPYTSGNDLVWIRFYTTNTSMPGQGFDLEFVISPVPARSCSSGEFMCANRKCIMASWRCNGITECGDNSDEIGCMHHYTGQECGKGQFLCKSMGRWLMECFPNSNLCDGKQDCLDGKDEQNCEHSSVCGEQIDKLLGHITSPLYDRKTSYPKNTDCDWTVHVHPGHTIQFRFVAFDLAPSTGTERSHGTGDSITFYNGLNENSQIFGTYDFYHKPPKTVESSSNWVFIRFHSGYDEMDLFKRGFNMSFQQKGLCLINQNKCTGEEDCYNPIDKCDGLWDCPRHGADERGCDKCDSLKFPCGSSNQCYSESEHCDGMGVCFDNKDEMNCTPDVCNTNNGTYLCQNFRCIYESWLCDGRDDCGDNSDELNCAVPSVRVILAAVVGSLVCALLLVIAIGCIIRLFSVRFHEHHGGSRYETPMSRIQAEFMRRQAPPTYTEAMRTSRPFSEFIAQVRAAGSNLRGNRSRSGSDVDLLVPSIDEENETAEPSVVEGLQNAGADDIEAEQTEALRRLSNASDITVSSSDSSLILIDSSEPGPSNATYDQELDEELSPNMTSCIDISSASSSGTTVQWTRENHNESQAEQSHTSNSNIENEPADGEILCSRDSNCDSIDSSPETDDEALLDALGSSSDISVGEAPDDHSETVLSGDGEVAESAVCLSPSNEPNEDVDSSNSGTESINVCVTDIGEPDNIESLPNV